MNWLVTSKPGTPNKTSKPNERQGLSLHRASGFLWATGEEKTAPETPESYLVTSTLVSPVSHCSVCVKAAERPTNREERLRERASEKNAPQLLAVDVSEQGLRSKSNREYFAVRREDSAGGEGEEGSYEICKITHPISLSLGSILCNREAKS